ncbi:hypothetical protein ABDK00_014005 [Niabella insulamsoli]|uniref:hypothetical protein n=1 Tax=Niabella insulamsoli TaxID=3144874 RepID=UPI0031FDD665
MGWITEILGSDNAKPVWAKFAHALDYIIGDLGSVIRTAAIVAVVYLGIAYGKLVREIKRDYVSPKEYALKTTELLSARARADSIENVLTKERQVFNKEAFRFIDLLRIKDSLLQEERFIRKGYENVIKKTIK